MQRSHNHPDVTGGGTLRHNPPTALESVAIERNAPGHIQSETPSDGSCTSPRAARALLTFQDSELSTELQNALTGHVGVGEAFDLRGAASAAMSVSQESIGMRSRGSGNSSSGHCHSHQSSLLSTKSSSDTESPILRTEEREEVRSGVSGSKDRDLQKSTDTWEFQSRSDTYNKLPFSPVTLPQTPSKKSHFVYPAVPPKSKPINLPHRLHQPHTSSPTPSPSPQPPFTPKTHANIHSCEARTGETPSMQPSQLPGAVTALEPQQNPTHYDLMGPHKKRTLSLTHFSLSDSEPGKGDDQSVPHTAASSVVMPSYATLSRRTEHGHANAVGLHRHINRSHSFAVRSRRKGPPPPPPKRMSSVSAAACRTENETTQTEVKGGAETPNRLEGGSRSSSPSRRIDVPPSSIPVSPVFSPVFFPVPRGSIARVKPANGFPGALRRTESERTVECRSKTAGCAEGTRQNGRRQMSEGAAASLNPTCASRLPFAEEGILTIKQRPRVAAAPGVLATTLKGPTPPDFNLKESDTVRRRHKPKDSLTSEELSSPQRETSQSLVSPHTRASSALSENDSQTTEHVLQRAGSLKKSPKPPVSSKPFSPHKPLLSSSPTPPPKSLSASRSGAQATIPNLTNIQVHTVSPKLGSDIQAQAGTSAFKPGQPEKPRTEKCAASLDRTGSRSYSTIGKGDQPQFVWGVFPAF